MHLHSLLQDIPQVTPLCTCLWLMFIMCVTCLWMMKHLQCAVHVRNDSPVMCLWQQDILRLWSWHWLRCVVKNESRSGAYGSFTVPCACGCGTFRKVFWQDRQWFRMWVWDNLSLVWRLYHQHCVASDWLSMRESSVFLSVDSCQGSYTVLSAVDMWMVSISVAVTCCLSAFPEHWCEWMFISKLLTVHARQQQAMNCSWNTLTADRCHELLVPGMLGALSCLDTAWCHGLAME
jgi:hypothetical protein